MSRGWDHDLVLAHRLADEAASVALRRFGGDVGIDRKADGTLVSAADLEVEEAIVATLLDQRPGDAVLSEERGTVGAKSDRRWIIDPIDGTDPFLAGEHWWGTHIALEESGRVVVGVLTRPARGLRWWAVRGRGTFVGESGAPLSEHRQVQVSDVERLRGAKLSGFFRKGSPVAAQLAEGATWIDIDQDVAVIPAVAEGRLDAVIDPGAGHEWDHAVQQILVTEAGGSFYDADGGQRIDTRVGIYTNGNIDPALLTRLGHLGIGPG